MTVPESINALRAQRFQVFRKACDLRARLARVDADRQLLVAPVGAAQGAADEGTDQLQRQVVDAVLSDVLVLLERDGLAGAGQAADEHQLHRCSLARRFGGGAWHVELRNQLRSWVGL